ncbi:MAG TPA: hypothetical protein VJH03_26155 [Blastocatellia bacterium]|nr:hypothetical protein [Blastocatellia bacterium]
MSFDVPAEVSVWCCDATDRAGLALAATTCLSFPLGATGVPMKLKVLSLPV